MEKRKQRKRFVLGTGLKMEGDARGAGLYIGPYRLPGVFDHEVDVGFFLGGF